MLPNRLKTPRRGKEILKRIVITGFCPPLIIENGKHIQDWNESLRTRLRKEGSALQRLAQLLTSKCQPITPNDNSASPTSTDDLGKVFKWPHCDEQLVDTQIDFFKSLNCNPETDSLC
jgi:hypothetical protein